MIQTFPINHSKDPLSCNTQCLSYFSSIHFMWLPRNQYKQVILYSEFSQYYCETISMPEFHILNKSQCLVNLQSAALTTSPWVVLCAVPLGSHYSCSDLYIPVHRKPFLEYFIYDHIAPFINLLETKSRPLSRGGICSITSFQHTDIFLRLGFHMIPRLVSMYWAQVVLCVSFLHAGSTCACHWPSCYHHLSLEDFPYTIVKP